MTTAPPPQTLAKFLRQVANQLDSHGDRALTMAKLLASRGFPSGGSGNGTPGGGNGSSSTENGALTDPGKWDGIDETLTTRMRKVWSDALDLQSTLVKVMSHASDQDPTPVGTGICHCKPLHPGGPGCDATCRPSKKNPNNRLRSGLCPSCWQAWLRWRAATGGPRHEFITHRRNELGSRQAVPK